jgi:hypothetical protein
VTISGTPRGEARPPGPDPFSLAVTPVTPIFRTTRLSTATGFFLRSTAREHFLVTNWHVVTGVNPITGAHISPTAAEPDRLEFDVLGPQASSPRVQQQVPLFDDEGRPIWLEHPRFGRNLDVVCIPIALTSGRVQALNTLNFDPIKTVVGLDAFIIGYPLGIGPGRLPIWKRASIASEPSVNVENLPLMYVDTATAAGMSGSPVILRTTNGDMEDGTFRMSFNLMHKLLGVYSGRQPVGDSFAAQLGRVWKTEALLEVANSGVRGSIR